MGAFHIDTIHLSLIHIGGKGTTEKQYEEGEREGAITLQYSLMDLIGEEDLSIGPDEW